ncbi:hypothetical protein LBMAG52_03500 [Planctomycetia bacterium]|nr:hypothetical protein LBMAG52_03500 [Planctomycetia bacterium]
MAEASRLRWPSPSREIESRQKVVDKYRDALPNLKSDFAKGEAVFRRECQACHRVNNIGTEIGPSLATIRLRAPDEVLRHTLGPNFVAYASSITLIRTTDTREIILRSNIEDIAATGQSLMPPAWKTESPRKRWLTCWHSCCPPNDQDRLSVPVLSPSLSRLTSMRLSIETQRLLSGVSFG